ncbi:aminopeptidase N [Thiosocius teredinicola]|uniref:aminopeptidase N n=1 Tax=Thiosocius teredinicola TaxID=1973002 RepID=UPI0009913AB3
MKEASPRTIRLKDYQPPDYLIETVDLSFDLREQGTRVVSRLAIKRNPQGKGGALKLNGEGLEPVWTRLNGSEMSADHYRIDEESLTLLDPPEAFVLESEVIIAPEKNTALEGLYRSGGMFCTQCEPEGFRKITWFLDRPDVMACFTVRLEADKAQYPVLLSNGNPRESGDLADGRHYAVWDDPIPKPSYLFALVAGDLRYIEDSHSTPSGRTVQLRLYVEPENIDKCDHAMRSLINAMRWDEEKYGREYDLDVYNVVAVNDFNMGAMENKGLNVFNSKYVLARADTATDTDFLGIEGVIGHEYFHNWTGNRITCRDWFQLSLKEGFTVFRDQEFSADMGARGVKRIEDVRMLRAHQFAEDASPMAHPIRPDSYIEINNFYTLTVYEKGAEVVRMQANLLGPELFRKATDLYFERHDGQAVTTEDFVRCMADASGKDLGQMQHWYDYAGTPQVKVQSEYDPEAQTFALTFEQSVPDTPGQTNKPPFLIPIVTGLVGADGDDLSVSLEAGGETATEHTLQLTQAKQQYVFHGVAQKPVPSLLRGFSAPVNLDYGYADDDLMFLMAHDSDGFNRWDAAQTLVRRVLLGMVQQYQDGVEMLVPDGVLEAFRRSLLDEQAQPALVAEVLALPSIGYLGDFMETVDIDGLHLARETLRAMIGRELDRELNDTYAALQEAGEYQPTPQAIGRRSLKNRVLGYLASASLAGEELCRQQYLAQHNMTDVMAALALIADGDHAAREEVLADFESRWRRDALVMDKWFGVQAMSNRSDTLDRVKALMQHHAFSMHNPNKVRALIGAFANANPVRFHAADGSGYEFLKKRVLELDPANPQIAARLVRALSRWRRYDEDRQAKMRAVLEAIVAIKVSKDVYEIASKSLDGG